MDGKLDARIIMKGWLIRDHNGSVIDASSNVILVKNDRTVLIDTGSRNEMELIKNLQNFGLTPKDVDYVINTHLHLDHAGNDHLFRKVIVHEIELNYCLKNYPKPFVDYLRSLPIEQINGEVELTKGMKIIETPGHTLGSISVVIKSDKIIVVCGDAIPTEENYRKWVPPRINVSSDLAMESMRKIARIADIIITGHGSMIELK